MSPTADSAGAAAADAIVPVDILADGEVVLLAIKPSGWFLLLVSWPVLVAAGVVGGLGVFAGERWGVAGGVVVPLCAAAALLRLTVASFQWLGRVYVLTDKRVMKIRGIVKVEVVQCPLSGIMRTTLSAGRGERMLGVAGLLFESDDPEAVNAAWASISRPAEVRDVVEEAIRRARARERRGGPN